MTPTSALPPLRQSTSWAVVADGGALQHLVHDLVEQADGSVLGVVRSLPEKAVTLRFPWIGASACICGNPAPRRVCAHIVAVLVGFARGNSKPRHEGDFERIWSAAGFPGSSAEAAREMVEH